MLYAGCYVNASVDMYAQDGQNAGIRCGLIRVFLDATTPQSAENRKDTKSAKLDKLVVNGVEIRERAGLYMLEDLYAACGKEKSRHPKAFLKLRMFYFLFLQLGAVKGRDSDSRIVNEVLLSKTESVTYVCQEIALMYAAWIDVNFCEKVARAFDRITPVTQLPQPEPVPRLAAIDPKALMLDGLREVDVPFPVPLEQAIDERAWEMTREAHQHIREHLRRWAQYNAVFGPAEQRSVFLPKALQAVQSATLGEALTRPHTQQLKWLAEHAETVSGMAQQYAAKMKAAVLGEEFV